jgi:iron-sulfur cluster repair protein YtfE (RIC family)
MPARDASMRELCARITFLDVAREVQELSRSVHFHMYLENNILYPRAIELENALRRPAFA